MKYLHTTLLLALSSLASSMPIGSAGSPSPDNQVRSNFSPIGNPTPDHRSDVAPPANFAVTGNKTPDSLSPRSPPNFNSFDNNTPDSV